MSRILADVTIGLLSVPKLGVNKEPSVSKPAQQTNIEEPKVQIIKKIKKTGKRLKLVDDETIKIRKPRAKKEPEGVARIIPAELVQIGDTPLENRLGTQKPKVLIKASSYYLNNREIFINFIDSLFAPYKKELLKASKTASCEKDETSGLGTSLRRRNQTHLRLVLWN